MAKNVFSVPIFFLVFRETLEAAIIISVLLGLAEQIARPNSSVRLTELSPQDGLENEILGTNDPNGGEGAVASSHQDGDEPVLQNRLLKKMRIQIFLGSSIGFLIALAIGAAFIAVWFTKASDLWKKSESLWEGVFYLIASIIIFVMGVTMLKIDRAKEKWRIKLQRAFEGKHVDGRTNTGKWVLFILPLVTVLREGLEAVVFVGGVSLGQPATSIPIAAVVGIICGLIVGSVIYTFASRAAITVFMIVMTNLILLIGSGLFSRSVGSFQQYSFNKLIRTDAADGALGDGPGSYDVRGNVWHLNCCNPLNTNDGNGWMLFGAIFGWSNSATIGTVLAYVFYWIAVIVTVVFAKWKEGRANFKISRFESPAAIKRQEPRSLLIT